MRILLRTFRPSLTWGVALLLAAVALAGCGAPAKPALAIVSLGSMSAAPWTLLTVTASGLDPALGPELQFEDDAGYSWTVPAMDVQADTAEFPVPPYASSAGWSSGAVDVRLLQGGKESDPVPGFQILTPPESPLPAGFLTWAIIDGIRAYAVALQDALDVPASDGLDVVLAELAAQLEGVQSGSSGSAGLGYLNGSPFPVDAGILADTDGLLMAWMASLDAEPPASGSSAPLVAAMRFGGQAADFQAGDSACAAGKNFEISVRVEDYLEGGRGIWGQHLGNVVNGVPCASDKTLEVIAASGAAGVSAMATGGASTTQLLLPSLALSTITTTLAGWQMALGMHLRGLHDAASKALLDSAVEKFDKQMANTLQALGKALSPFAPPLGEPPPWEGTQVVDKTVAADKALANRLIKDGCALTKAFADVTCPKWEDLWRPTSPTSSTTSATFNETVSPGTYVGDLSGRWGLHADGHGCSWDITFSGPLTLALTPAGDGDDAGTGELALDVLWTLAADDSETRGCFGFEESAAASGQLEGSPSSFTATLDGSDGYALDVRLDGSAAGESVHVTGSVGATVWSQNDRSDLRSVTVQVAADLRLQ